MSTRSGVPLDHVQEVLHFQGRRIDWLAAQTGIPYVRLQRLVAGKTQYREWEAEQVSLALQVPLQLLFPDRSVLRGSASGRQRGTSARTPPAAAPQPEAVAS